MALRNQPYIPLYVQDFLTDERLMECSAAATGVYIRIMCIMHKSEIYGTIELKQKDKQNVEQNLKQINLFASKLVKFLPYDLPTILQGLTELLDEGVLVIDGDLLIQRRMLKDGEISEKRAIAGGNGGKTSQQNKAKDKANLQANNKAKVRANSEYENEIENESKDDIVNKYLGKDNGGKKNQKDVAIRAMVLDLCPQFDNSDFFMAWADWEQVRREKKRPITYTAAKLALKKLSGYDLPTVIQALQNSASNSWQGVFPEKTDRPMQKPQIYEQMEATYRQFYQSKCGELYPKFNPAEQNELVSIIDKLTQM